MACGVRTVPPDDVNLIHRTGLANNHVASCDDDSLCGDGQNPPVGGPHCSQTLSCRAFDTEQKRCQWIHNLEHGHAVLAYNCPQGCAAVVDGLVAIQQAERAKGNARVIVTPDAQLPNRVAAVVWGWGWVGDEVNEAAIAAVLAKQDIDSPEAHLSCAP